MFRVLQFEKGHPPKCVEGSDLVSPPPEGVLRWIDLEEQDDAQLKLLAERFGFHPLTIEDCAHFDQRPKYEDYDGYAFIVAHGFELRHDDAEYLHILELHTFLADRYLVTVHDESLTPLNSVWDRLKSDATSANRGVDFIRYLIADAIVDSFFPLIDHLGNEVEEVEDSLLDDSQRPSSLEEILQLKRLFVAMRKVLSPQRSVIAQLSKRQGEYVSERTSLYFRDVYDHLLRISESLEANRDLLEGVLEAYHWKVSQRTNEVVKRLTLLSAIFLPLTFITGFFGQNFEALPFGSNELMVAMLMSCLVVPVGMLWFFLRSKWY